MFGISNAKKEMKNAENEYINSQKDIANEYWKQVDEENFDQDLQQAEQNASEIAQLQNQQESNAVEQNQKLTGKTSKMANSMNNSDMQNEYIQKQAQAQSQNLATIQANRENKNKQIIAAKQLASDESKKKYELAQQSYQQAVSTRNNICKTLQTLGVAVSVIPGLQWVGAVTTGLATVGSMIE